MNPHAAYPPKTSMATFAARNHRFIATSASHLGHAAGRFTFWHRTNPLPRNLSMISIVPCHTQRQRGRLSILSAPDSRRLRQDLKLSWPERRLHDAMFHVRKGVIPMWMTYGVQAAASRKQIQSSRWSLVLPYDTRVFEGTRKFQKTLGCLEISRQPAQDTDHRW